VFDWATGAARSYIGRMVKITISAKAFAALAATWPVGSVAAKPTARMAAYATRGFEIADARKWRQKPS
jgi:hypothetical protein